jgi:acyl carrier protein
MTHDAIKAEIKTIIGDIAPDEDLAVLTDEGVIRQQLNLDSMDFLDIIMELRKRHKIHVPEEDYKHFLTLNSSAEYLAPRLVAAGNA